MSELRVALLGTPVVQHGERPVVFRTRKSLALLAYLAADATPRTREHLRSLLWPDHDAEHAGALLRRTLAFLRQSLGEQAAAPRHLAADDVHIALVRAAELSVDIDAFGPAHGLMQTPDAIEAAERVVALYRGSFLQDLALEDAPEFEAWLDAERVAWQNRLEGLLDALFRGLTGSGRIERALQHGLQWTDRLPTSEIVTRGVMEAQLAAGLKAQARLSLERLRAALARELGVEPSPELVALVESLAPLVVGPVGTAATTVGRLPLVGRDADLEFIASAFREVAAGATRGVVLSGEAGIGKTTLALQATNWAATQGADLLSGAAFETGGRLTYGAVVEALRERLARENAPADLVDDVWLGMLVHVLPELKERYPDLEALPLADEMAQIRLFEAVARLLEALAARAPLVWLVDDVQWTDSGTRDLLLYLVRRWARSPQRVLVLLAVRAEAVAADATLQRWLRELRRVGGIAERNLGPLSETDVECLLTHVQPRDVTSETRRAWADWLWAETRGQPFYVVETLRALGEQKVLEWRVDSDGRWNLGVLPPSPSAAMLRSVLPASVRDLIQARLEMLDGAARGVVAVGAVLGGRMALDALAAVAGFGDEDLLEAIEQLVRTGVWEELPPSASGRRIPRYAFAHDRVREVAYAGLSSARRRGLHRKVLDALQTMGTEVQDLAVHAREGDLPELAFRYSVAAGDARMSVFAVTDALNEYEHAHALLHAQPDRLTAATEVLPRLGRAYEVAHRLAEARAIHQELRTTARSAGAARVESQALTALGTLTIHERWDADAAVELVSEAARIAEASGEVAAQAESEWSLAQILAYAHGRERAVVHARRAVHLARQTDNLDLQARSLNALAMAHLILGQAGPCGEAARESLELFRGCGNDLMRWDSQRLVAASHFQLGDARTTLAVAREALDGCTRARNLWGQAWGAKEVVHALLDLDAVDEAVGMARSAVEAARTLDDPVALCMALTLACRAYRRSGELSRARTAALEASELDSSVPTRPLRESILSDLAACALATGDWDSASRHAQEALEVRDGTMYLDTGLTRWMETAALVRTGHGAEAEADLCTWSTRLDGCPRYQIPYLRALAEVAEWRGLVADATAYRQQARELAQGWRLQGEVAADASRN